MGVSRGIAAAAVLVGALVLYHFTRPAERLSLEAGAWKELSFTRPGFEEFSSTAQTLIPEALVERMLQGEAVPHWSGKQLSVAEQIALTMAKVKELILVNKGFRKLSSHSGVGYEINDALTAANQGDGLFRLTAKIKIGPRLFLALVTNCKLIGSMDETVIAMYDRVQFPKSLVAQAANVNGRARLAYWANKVGYPLSHRDGADITAWNKDEDKDSEYWFSSHSIQFDPHPDTVRAYDTYFGYRLRSSSSGEGTGTETETETDVVMVSQTLVGGYLPKFAINQFVGQVLADYIRNVEAVGLEMIRTGEADALVKFHGLF